MHAASAMVGFASASDKQRIDAFVSRAKRSTASISASRASRWKNI